MCTLKETTMQAEIKYLTKLLIGLKIEDRHFVRIIYSGVLNKYEGVFKPPQVQVMPIEESKTIEKYSHFVPPDYVLVSLFRTAKCVAFSWNSVTAELRPCDTKILGFEDWLNVRTKIHQSAHWDYDMKLMRKDPLDFATWSLKSVRSLASVKLAIEKVEKVMLMLLHISDQGIDVEAKEVLRFVYNCERHCGQNPRNFAWYTPELKLEAESENDAERDRFVSMFRQTYDNVKITALSNLLISYGTDVWGEMGYAYPPFFSECGTPVQSRYKLFMSYIEFVTK
jgi:hypothetical protein